MHEIVVITTIPNLTTAEKRVPRVRKNYLDRKRKDTRRFK